MKKIGIITYDNNHLKTEQILIGLYGSYQISVYALPYTQRPSRNVLLQHRPDQSVAAHPRDLCRAYGYRFIPVERDDQIDNTCELYIITGAGILSSECLRGKRVLNCHPGIIPAVRGLDAFKWSIYRMLPMGNTLHYVDAEVDKGEIVMVQNTPVFLSDSIQSFARRHYENEIEMLKNFEYNLQHPSNPFKEIEQQENTRRMPAVTEVLLFAAFEEYKAKYALNQ